MSDIITQKRCSECGVVKSVEEFRKRNGRNGWYPCCKACEVKYTQEWKLKRLANDPEYREKLKEINRKSVKKRHTNDPELREKINKRNRERMANNPELRERKHRRDKEYANDPEVAERKKVYAKEWKLNNPKQLKKYSDKQKEKYNNDPEYREKQRKREKERRSTPEYKERARKRRATPKHREYMKKACERYRKRWSNTLEYRKRVAKLAKEHRARDPEYREKVNKWMYESGYNKIISNRNKESVKNLSINYIRRIIYRRYGINPNTATDQEKEALIKLYGSIANCIEFHRKLILLKRIGKERINKNA